jgi:hypothetical protein
MNRRSALCAALFLVAVAGSSRQAGAKPRASYVFLISRVELSPGIPKEVEAQTAARVKAAIAAHERLESSLDAGAPDPEAQPQKFKEYLKAHRQRAFKVNVEVTDFSSEVETASAGRGKTGQYLTVRTSLRLFGETVPDRVMAFTGDGSATIKIEIGKTPRPRDREEATSSALDEAANTAIAQALRKLDEPPPSAQKKKPGKK